MSRDFTGNRKKVFERSMMKEENTPLIGDFAEEAPAEAEQPEEAPEPAAEEAPEPAEEQPAEAEEEGAEGA